MAASHRKFGELLEEGIKRVHLVQKKPIGVILDEFGYELRPDGTKGRYALGHWYYKKRIPADMADVEKLARLIVLNSDVDQKWVEQFLASADHPSPAKMSNQFFVPPPLESPISAPIEAEKKGLPPEPIVSAQSVSMETKTAPAGVKKGLLLVLIFFCLIAVTALAGRLLGSRLFPVAVSTNLTPTHTIAPAAAPTIIPTQPVSPTPTPRATASPTCTVTLEPSVTPMPVSSVTIAPSAFDGHCPVVSSSAAFVYTQKVSFREYLNTGGSLAQLQLDFAAQAIRNSALHYGQVSSGDLTGDGVDEIVISLPESGGSWWQILGCHAGAYYPLFEELYNRLYVLQAVLDLTADKKAEILRFAQTLDDNTHIAEYSIQKWDGVYFVELMDQQRIDTMGALLSADTGRWDHTIVSATAILSDTNHDRLLDVIVRGGIAYDTPTCETVYQRVYTDTWVWNGKSFQISDRTFSSPTYRYQAAADGDVAFLFKQYDKALFFYQRVAFDVNLQPHNWYPPQLEYCARVGASQEGAEIDPVTESYQLDAYARWRILLIHIVQNHMDAAETVYTTLQERYSLGKVGTVYALAAKAFWDAYQVTPDAAAACVQVSQAVQDLPLYPGHTLDSICPMK